MPATLVALATNNPFVMANTKTIEGTLFKSLQVQFEENKEGWLCQCKLTKNPPYCDGSHHLLKTT